MTFDIMRAAFPGDPTTGTTVRDVSLLQLRDYAERVLFRDANLPLNLPPRLVAIAGDAASDTDTQFTFDEFCSRMDDLKYHAEFSGYDGDTTFTDFIVHFGRLHSADRDSLGAFKHFAYMAVGQYVRSHNQFAKRPFCPEAIHFFHVFDNETAEDNWHCHFILIPT
jgi:hypothetical protein